MKICDTCGRRIDDQLAVLSRTGRIGGFDDLHVHFAKERGEEPKPPQPYHQMTEWIGGREGFYGGATPRTYLCGPLRDVNAQDDFMAWVGV